MIFIAPLDSIASTVPNSRFDAWTTAAGLEEGKLLRPVLKSGKVVGESLSDWAVWSVVEQSAREIGIERFGAHDLRRTCAKLLPQEWW